MSLETIPLPHDLAARLAEIGGHPGQAPRTVADLADAMRQLPTPGRDDLVTTEPTAHRVEAAGRVEHVHCAMDALMLPLLDGSAGEVVSHDPTTSDELRLTVDPGGLRSSSHPDAVVSLGIARTGAGPMQQIGCPFINLFTSRAAYDGWSSSHPEVASIGLPLADAFALVRAIATSTETDAPAVNGGGCCGPAC